MVDSELVSDVYKLGTDGFNVASGGCGLQGIHGWVSSGTDCFVSLGIDCFGSSKIDCLGSSGIGVSRGCLAWTLDKMRLELAF